MDANDCPYVSRGGLKLAQALDAFQLDLTGYICADLGCSTGGFTDCLLQHGAAHVYSVDTAYGEFAWKLRNDARVTLRERTNAIHFDPVAQMENFAGCDLVAIDLGWTRQEKAIPVALQWLKQDSHSRVITLIKPQYEREKSAQHARNTRVLSDEETQSNLERVLAALPAWGVELIGWIPSPIRGGKGGKGNMEYLACLKRG